MITGISDVTEAFNRMLRTDYGPVANEVKNSYVEQVFEVHAIKTGRFIRSINWQSGEKSEERQSFFIDTLSDVQVTYDGWIEFGHGSMKARYPAKRGIIYADIGSIFDVLVDDAFGAGNVR